eukprot:355759-Chlamydomonas_euryale.AAC.2
MGQGGFKNGAGRVWKGWVLKRRTVGGVNREEWVSRLPVLVAVVVGEIGGQRCAGEGRWGVWIGTCCHKDRTGVVL